MQTEKHSAKGVGGTDVSCNDRHGADAVPPAAPDSPGSSAGSAEPVTKWEGYDIDAIDALV